MAGTSWDKLGQTEAAFAEVAPAIRAAAGAQGARLHEFFRDDPVWRLDFSRSRPGDAAIDVSWDEERPLEFTVTALWWSGEQLQREPAGTHLRGTDPGALERLLGAAAARLPEAR